MFSREVTGIIKDFPSCLGPLFELFQGESGKLQVYSSILQKLVYRNASIKLFDILSGRLLEGGI